MALDRTGNVKVTRDEWLCAALAVLTSDGVEAVKIADLAAQLQVSRSSFYWYFRNRTDLLDALLAHWQSTNTAALVAQANAPAATITEAVCNVFRCNIDTRLYDPTLDFAIRDWARRSDHVRDILSASDGERLEALRAMFERYGYAAQNARARARVLYYMQMGYEDARLGESLEERLKLVPDYLLAFTGQAASAQEIADFEIYARSI